LVDDVVATEVLHLPENLVDDDTLLTEARQNELAETEELPHITDDSKSSVFEGSQSESEMEQVGTE
jgi:hypothetical protein